MEIVKTLREGAKAAQSEWRKAWRDKHFRRMFLAVWPVLAGLLSLFPVFFRFAERRTGRVVSDKLLEIIPATDVSGGVFFLVWSMALACAVYLAARPCRLLVFMGAYLLVSAVRMTTIYLFPLEPPTGLIELIDPLSSAFYDGRFVTKDLFFSGHTATMFLLYLSLSHTRLRHVALTATALVGAGVLVQHVHYTIDVLAAPVVAFGCWRFSRKAFWAKNG